MSFDHFRHTPDDANQFKSFQEEVVPSDIENILNMSFDEFREKYSTNDESIKGFDQDKDIFFVTNEIDYPFKLDQIKVRGGIHLAIMGGLDPVLGQLAVAHPELTLMEEINGNSIDVMSQERLPPLGQQNSGKEYWAQIHQRVIEELYQRLPGRVQADANSDISIGGWSSPKYYALVQKAFKEGRIKAIKANMAGEGLEFALALAHSTKIPIKLIYFSNIFTYPVNSRKLLNMIPLIRSAIDEGSIDPNAQIIEIGSLLGLETTVLPISEWLDNNW